MEVPFTPEEQAEHAQQGFICLGAAEITDKAEDGGLAFHVELFADGEPWCSTPSCTSIDLEGVKITGQPTLITDRRGRERDLLLYPYEGHCPKCGVSHLGGFGNYQDGSHSAETRYVFLFNAGRVRADEPTDLSPNS
jgi:hypothetical protein